jgi:hypothetical protein
MLTGVDTEAHQRRSIRLAGYDYAQAGAYFVTICAGGRNCLFGEIIDGEMQLNDAGRVATRCWNEIPAHFHHAALDEFVVMPNHVHGIIFITVGGRVAPTHKPEPLPEAVLQTLEDITQRAERILRDIDFVA